MFKKIMCMVLAMLMIGCCAFITGCGANTWKDDANEIMLSNGVNLRHTTYIDGEEVLTNNNGVSMFTDSGLVVIEYDISYTDTINSRNLAIYEELVNSVFGAGAYDVAMEEFIDDGEKYTVKEDGIGYLSIYNYSNDTITLSVWGEY